MYLSDDMKHERKVAVKVLRPELAVAVGQDRFLWEITTTANPRHPHVLPLFDSGEEGGFLFYALHGPQRRGGDGPARHGLRAVHRAGTATDLGPPGNRHRARALQGAGGSVPDAR